MVVPVTIPSSSSHCRIRSRYLSKLGILPQQQQPGDPQTARPPITRAVIRAQPQSPVLSSIANPNNHHEMFKTELFLPHRRPSNILTRQQQPPEEEEKDDDASSSSHLSPSSPPRVQFLMSVAVKEIPSHRDYDKVDRRNLWNSKHVLEQNRQRNAFEFWADGMDWRNATEEEDMIRTRRGRLVHPATWKLLHDKYSMQQQQLQQQHGTAAFLSPRRRQR